jgi:ferredoxin-thioredoxin reductase catalytic subunit
MTKLQIPIEKVSSKEAFRMCRETSTIETIIALTKHEDPIVRQRALREMCPCRVKDDLAEFWTRVIEMKDDPADNVRQQVLHTLCDGSPNHMEYKVIK